MAGVFSLSGKVGKARAVTAAFPPGDCLRVLLANQPTRVCTRRELTAALRLLAHRLPSSQAALAASARRLRRVSWSGVAWYVLA